MLEILTALFFLKDVFPEPTELQKYKWEQERRRRKIRNAIIGIAVLLVLGTLLVLGAMYLREHVQVSVKP